MLELSAAKSTLGHAEPAAGAVGMLRALFRLHSGTAAGVLHLTAINPYITGSLEQLQQGDSGWGVWMPRGHSAAGSPASSQAWQGAVGISGFAFQGTNAHVVLGRWAYRLVCWLWAGGFPAVCLPMPTATCYPDVSIVELMQALRPAKANR